MCFCHSDTQSDNLTLLQIAYLYGWYCWGHFSHAGEWWMGICGCCLYGLVDGTSLVPEVNKWYWIGTWDFCLHEKRGKKRHVVTMVKRRRTITSLKMIHSLIIHGCLNVCAVFMVLMFTNGHLPSIPVASEVWTAQSITTKFIIITPKCKPHKIILQND